MVTRSIVSAVENNGLNRIPRQGDRNVTMSYEKCMFFMQKDDRHTMCNAQPRLPNDYSRHIHAGGPTTPPSHTVVSALQFRAETFPYHQVCCSNHSSIPSELRRSPAASRIPHLASTRHTRFLLSPRRAHIHAAKSSRWLRLFAGCFRGSSGDSPYLCGGFLRARRVRAGDAVCRGLSGWIAVDGVAEVVAPWSFRYFH
jgi:hypothetical protein